MSKVGTVHIEIKPVLNEQALADVTARIEAAIAEAQSGGEVIVGHYDEADRKTSWTGWIEDRARSWIIYLGAHGAPSVYWPRRDENGGVVGTPIDLTA